MKKFVLFPELLGSDQLYPCDGRWSNATCVDKAREHAKTLSKTRHFIITIGHLCVGSILSPTVVKNFDISTRKYLGVV